MQLKLTYDYESVEESKLENRDWRCLHFAQRNPISFTSIHKKKKKKKFAGAWLDKVGREKQTAREDGWGLHTHDSGTATASQQSNQHSLTASPNNQLKAKDVSQKRRRKSRGELWRTSGSDSAAVNSYSGVFLLTGVSSALRLYLSSCPPVDSEHTALQNFTD